MIAHPAPQHQALTSRPAVPPRPAPIVDGWTLGHPCAEEDDDHGWVGYEWAHPRAWLTMPEIDDAVPAPT